MCNNRIGSTGSHYVKRTRTIPMFVDPVRVFRGPLTSGLRFVPPLGSR